MGEVVVRRPPSDSKVSDEAVHGTRSGVEEPAASAAAPRPWFYACKVLMCPTCKALPGRLCVYDKPSKSPFHFARYALARELADVPMMTKRDHASKYS